MKTLLILILSALTLRAATFTLLWDANPASDFVTSYSIYEKLVSGTMNRIATVATNTAVFTNVTAGAHTWSVTALNANGESGFSSMITFTNIVGIPGTPTNVTIKVSAVLQSSPGISGPWNDFLAIDVPPFTNTPGFYRMKVMIAQTAPPSTAPSGKMFVIPQAPKLPK